MSSQVGTAYVRLYADTSRFQAEAQTGVQKSGTALGSLFAKAFALASAGAIGKSVVNAALEHQSAFAVLDKTIQNAGATNNLYGQSIETLLEKEARLKGFSDEQLASSFQRLVSVTHDSAAGFKLLGEAEDLARFRHISVEQASLALAKAEQGNATALQRYGIIVPKVTAAVDALHSRYVALQEQGAKLDPVQKAQYEGALKIAEAQDKQATAAEALAQVQSRVGGSAGTFAGTDAGKIARATQNYHQFEVEIGDKVIPVIGVLFDHLSLVGHLVEGLGTAFVASKALGYIESLGVATTAEAGAAGAAAGTLSALTAALAANTAALTGDAAAASTLVTIFGPLGEELSVVKTSAAAANTEVGALRGSLAGLAALGPIAAVVALSVIPGNSGGQSLLDQTPGGGFLGKLPVIGGLAQQTAALAGKVFGREVDTERPNKNQAYLDDQARQAIQDIAGTGKIADQKARVLKALEAAQYSPAEAKKRVADLFGTLADSATEGANHAKPKLTAAAKSMLQSLTQGIASDQTDLADLRQQMSDAITQGVQAVDQAVNQAKQNLNTIGQSLSSEIAAIIDKPLQDAQARLTAAQNKIGLQSAKTTLRTLGQEVLLPGGHRLSSDPEKAIAQLERLQKTAHGSPGLQAFIQQYQQAALGVDSAQLAIRQQAADKTKTRASQHIADLTDQFNKGEITARQFNVAITRELVRDGASYKKAGKLLGESFADGFAADVKGLADQMAALVGGPQRPGTGLGPSIVRPIETLQQVTKQEAGIAKQQRDKQHSLTVESNKLLTKIHQSQAAKDFTKSLARNVGLETKVLQQLVGLP